MTAQRSTPDEPLCGGRGAALDGDPVSEVVALLVAAAAEHERAARWALARSHLRRAQELSRDRHLP